jgi:predicted RNA binding protein YcfA (HicA-like mRNA interferase family)
MNWNELKKIAIKKGWLLVRHGKKHDLYYHPNKNYQIQIERHSSKEIKNGICHDILKKL